MLARRLFTHSATLGIVHTSLHQRERAAMARAVLKGLLYRMIGVSTKRLPLSGAFLLAGGPKALRRRTQEPALDLELRGEALPSDPQGPFEASRFDMDYLARRTSAVQALYPKRFKTNSFRTKPAAMEQIISKVYVYYPPQA